VKKKVAILINTPLVGFTDPNHLNCWLKSLNHVIDNKNSEYIYDLFICFLDPDTLGTITSRDISYFSKDTDHSIEYVKELKDKNIKNIKKLNIPNCINKFKYAVTTINCGYGLIEWKFLDRFLVKDEILEYDYLFKSSDATYNFVPNSYTKWVEYQDRWDNFYSDIPITFYSPLWHPYCQPYNYSGGIQQYSIDDGIHLNRGHHTYLFKPRKLKEVCEKYNLPKWGSSNFITGLNIDESHMIPITSKNIELEYECPWVFLIHYTLFYLRKGVVFSKRHPETGKDFPYPNDIVTLDMSKKLFKNLPFQTIDPFHIEAFSYTKVFVEELKYQLILFDFIDKSDYTYYRELIFIIKNKTDIMFKDLSEFYENNGVVMNENKLKKGVELIKEKVKDCRVVINELTSSQEIRDLLSDPKRYKHKE
jgi:hypothetical protein